MIGDVPVPTGRFRGMVDVLPNAPIVRVDWRSFWLAATMKQLTFHGQHAAHLVVREQRGWLHSQRLALA